MADRSTRRCSNPACSSSRTQRRDSEKGVWELLKDKLDESERTRCRTVGEEIVKRACLQVGSVRWSRGSDHRGMAGESKAHVFVAETIEESGAALPHRWPRFLKWSPIAAAEWCNQGSTPLTEHPDWARVANPALGDVAAEGGHVGIVTRVSPGETVSASGSRVAQTDWGFRPGQKTTYWRYKGGFK